MNEDERDQASITSLVLRPVLTMLGIVGDPLSHTCSCIDFQRHVENSIRGTMYMTEGFSC